MAIDPNIQTEIHSPRLGLNKDDDLVGLRHGRPAVLLANRPGRVVRHFDDFFGDVLADEWNFQEGSDSSTSAAVVVAGIGGTLQITTGDSATLTMAGNGAQFESFLSWQASNGGLYAEARLQLDIITSQAIFFGFTDQVAALEMPFNSAGSADTITSNASNGVGFMFDTAMTTDEWWAVGVKADTDGTHVTTGVGPTAATYQTLRVEVDADGNAAFFIDGVRKATMTSAITGATDLTPVIAGFARATTSVNILVDYIDVGMDR